jgi:hypothetical protein
LLPLGIGHNGGPPLEDHVPEWGLDGPGQYFRWKGAREQAWRPKSRDHALFRLARAEQVGLTYEEYTLEILERGRRLQVEDVERVAAIKARRPASTKPA